MFPLKDDNPTTITPIVTWLLIFVNVMIFLYQVSLGPRESQLFAYAYGAVPSVVTGQRHLPVGFTPIPPLLSMCTSMFLHGGWMHLIGNMWFLWIFGNNIEEAMGSARFILFYGICGFLASLSHVLANAGSTLPSIGASGAIAGVMGAYLLLYPFARVLTLIYAFIFIRFVYVPAALVLGIWFLFQLLSGSMAGGQEGGGIAFWAHVGGFIAGILLVGVFKKKKIRFFNPARQETELYNG